MIREILPVTAEVSPGTGDSVQSRGVTPGTGDSGNNGGVTWDRRLK